MGKVAWQDVKGAMVLAGSYDEAVKMMGDLNFLQALMNFPKEAINDETVELLQVGGCDVWVGEWGARALAARCALRAADGCTRLPPPWGPPNHPPTPSPPPAPLHPAHPLPPRHPPPTPQPYFAAPDYNYDSAKKASGNVAGLCNWAASMCKYHAVAKVGGCDSRQSL